MPLVTYIIFYPLLWLFSILPMRILYVISDILYLIVYYVLGYRKKVVRQNLQLSFPEKSQQELLELERRSIRHFIDQFMELIKSFTITEKELARRVSLANHEILESYYNKNKSIVIISGHYANWEWVPFIVQSRMKYHLNVVYKKLSNPYFDKLIRRTRKKFGVSVIPTKEFYPAILKNLKDQQIGAYGFIADQSPKWGKVKYWGRFMGIEIPVITGPEMIARKLDFPVYYFKTERVKRGYYHSSFVLLEDQPKQVPLHQITDKFIQELEKQIYQAPEFYFWTHKRFKHIGRNKT